MESAAESASAVDVTDVTEQQPVDVTTQPEVEKEGEDVQPTIAVEEQPVDPAKEAEVAVVVDKIVADVVASSETSEDAIMTAEKSDKTKEERGAAAELVAASSSETMTSEETVSETTETTATETKTMTIEPTEVESSALEVMEAEEIDSEEAVPEVPTAVTTMATEDSLAREAAEDVASTIVERVIAEAISSVDDAVLNPPSLTPKLNESIAVPASSQSMSSDEEGWRSDDTDSVDGGDGSKKKKKSRAFPVRSMISRFANKMSSSMPKKRVGAHRTESAAKLELETPSPVHGAVTRLESPHEDKSTTHRTDSAAKLDVDGNSPVKHIVNRFESPQHKSLDNLKIRTVRTFFDEKERSIHVDEEKEKYDAAAKSGGEATPTKASPTARKAVKPSPKAEVATPASPAPIQQSAEDIDSSTATPVKNMVSRFEKKPEQSLDNLSFRTVRTFFPTIEEPSIRVGAEKQKYEALTEQQKAEVRRLEEEKLAKTKAAAEVEATAEVDATAAASRSVEEEHVFHVRDLAHQLEARSSLTQNLAPVSLSRSSSGTSERADAVRTRLARSISNSSDRSGSAAPPSLTRTTSASSDRPPRFVTRSQSDASSHHGDSSAAEFHVKDVAQQFESRIPPSPQSVGAAPVRRSSAAEVTLGAAHNHLRHTSDSSSKDVHIVANERKTEEGEVFNVRNMAHRFEAASLSRQSSAVESAATPTHVNSSTPPRFRRTSSQGSASNTPMTPAPAPPAVDHEAPTQVQVTANAVLETTRSANVRDIAHRFETNRAQSVETPAYRTMETFFAEVDEPSIRVGAEKAKLDALEKQKELEAKLAWAKSLHAEEEAAAAAAAASKKTETLHWFLMPAATNPAFIRLHSVLSDRDPMTALALFPRQEPADSETDSDLVMPLIPTDLPTFASSA